MTLELILFIIFALICAVTSVLMITRSNPIISALFLILNFAALAGIYLLLHAQFIAVAQVIVYAGAIMVLFLFVIMLLRPEKEKLLAIAPRLKISAFVLAFIVLVQLVYMIFVSGSSGSVKANAEMSIKAGTIETIGTELFSKYILPVEAVGFLLLAAAIGALVLAKKKFE
ncbi:MAG: NADH-quinone oxidoreductase subunit J [Ignavibacteriaceae bacterium]|nr:NADH-quinone oxidoreductase subunit J [Ignavibacteriaceae bacterium]